MVVLSSKNHQFDLSLPIEFMLELADLFHDLLLEHFVFLVVSLGDILLLFQNQTSSINPQITSLLPSIIKFSAHRYLAFILGKVRRCVKTLEKFALIEVIFLGFLSIPFNTGFLPQSLLTKSKKITPFLQN